MQSKKATPVRASANGEVFMATAITDENGKTVYVRRGQHGVVVEGAELVEQKDPSVGET